jgi:hypothetical protein
LAAGPCRQAIALQRIWPRQLTALLALIQQLQLSSKLRPLLLHFLLHRARIKAAGHSRCCTALCWLDCQAQLGLLHRAIIGCCRCVCSCCIGLLRLLPPPSQHRQLPHVH